MQTHGEQSRILTGPSQRPFLSFSISKHTFPWAVYQSRRGEHLKNLNEQFSIKNLQAQYFLKTGKGGFKLANSITSLLQLINDTAGFFLWSTYPAPITCNDTSIQTMWPRARRTRGHPGQLAHPTPAQEGMFIRHVHPWCPGLDLWGLSEMISASPLGCDASAQDLCGKSWLDSGQSHCARLADYLSLHNLHFPSSSCTHISQTYRP